MKKGKWKKKKEKLTNKIEKDIFSDFSLKVKMPIEQWEGKYFCGETKLMAVTQIDTFSWH